MKSSIALFLAAIGMLAFVGATNAHAGATRVADVIWADGDLYSTIITPATFTAPPERTTDALYAFDMSGLNGQRPVSAAKPGDTDYNGGRWAVKAVMFTAAGVEALGDGFGNIAMELASEAEILAHEADGHLTVMDTTLYFECPLLP